VRADFVFVHGFTQTAASWAPVMELLSADTRSLAVPVAGDFTATAAALDVGPATYAGYSQGGRLCLQLALDRPGVVDRLVLVSASPGIAAEPARTARREADERLAREIERDGVDAFLERWLAQPLFATLPRERSGIDERRARNTIEGLTYQLRVLGQGVQPSNWARLGELRIDATLERMHAAEEACELVRAAWREAEELQVSTPLALEAIMIRLHGELAAIVPV